jgi:hypothetical protein
MHHSLPSYLPTLYSINNDWLVPVLLAEWMELGNKVRSKEALLDTDTHTQAINMAMLYTIWIAQESQDRIRHHGESTVSRPRHNTTQHSTAQQHQQHSTAQHSTAT